MLRGLSTHVFLEQRLNAGMLDSIARTGIQSIQVFAARHHFDYMDRGAVREIAEWFRCNPVEATLHQPLYPDANFSKHLSPSLNLIHVEKSQRINAMDEVKRAIESAESIPFTAVVLHLGMRDEPWNTRALEHSLTAIEHLKAFAHPLGVKVLLENLVNDVTTPEHLMEILRVGHFDNVGICLDTGHANLFYGGVPLALEQCGSRVRQLHLHDNKGTRDEHLWPGAGSIDWKALAPTLAALPADVTGVLEIAHDLNETETSIQQKVPAAFDLLGIPPG